MEFDVAQRWLASAVMAALADIRRLSIRATDHDVDVALPAHLPIAELVPALVDLIGIADVGGTDPRLIRVCGQVLDPAATLAQCLIPDGELLILTGAVERTAPTPRFDASTVVADSAAALAHASEPAAGRRARWVVVYGSAAVLTTLLGYAILDPDAARHNAIGSAGAVLALAGAVGVRRARRDQAGAVGLGVLATTLAGLTAALACPGRPGMAGYLLAMSAIAAASLLSWRLLDCGPSVFLPLAAVAMMASATALGAVVGWWPTPAVGPMLVMGSLAALALSARLSVHSAGLSAADLSDAELEARTRTAHRRLTAIVVAAAAASALGAIVTATTTAQPVVSAGFLTITGVSLLLRARRHDDSYRIAALILSSGVAVTSLIVLCAADISSSTPWLCWILMMVGAGAAWSVHQGPARWPVASRRVIFLLELAAGAAVVPVGAAAAGAFGALPAIGLA